MGERILVLQHVDWEGPGLFEKYATECDIALDVLRLYAGDRIPRKLNGVLAVIILGSPMTAYRPETNPRYGEELAFVNDVRRQGIAGFYVCYGMQLFTHAFEGEVEPNPRGKEVGLCMVRLTEEGKKDPIFRGVGEEFETLQWHGDHVARLPAGAKVLAYSDLTPIQVAVVDGTQYLFQGDGQAATPELVRLWLEEDYEWAAAGTDIDPERLVNDVAERREYLEGIYRRIFQNFVEIASSARAGSHGSL